MKRTASSTVIAAPTNWLPLYNAVKDIRRKLEAPVDTIGCDRLFNPSDTPENQRYQTLLALMLSAQTRDQMTAQAMERLHAIGCNAKTINALSEDKVKEAINCVCFYNNKAKHIKATTHIIVKEHKGVVPSDYNTLTSMPGLGPKMVHLFLQCADGKTQGIGVDVHMHRIFQRWKWVPEDVKSPEDTRKAMEAWLPKEHWREVNAIVVGFGQTVCTPRNPKCSECAAAEFCPNAFKECSSASLKRRKSSSSISSVKKEEDHQEVSSSSDVCDDIEDILEKKGSRGKGKQRHR